MANTTIYVWLPTFKKPEGGVPKSTDEAVTKALSSIENVGHAAVALSNEAYISWWPDQSVSPGSGFQSPSFRVHTFQEDFAAEGGSPGVSVNLQGLQEDVMRSWWDRVADSGRRIART
jgi:hypothetical protein